MHQEFVIDISICIILAWILAVSAQLLRQPLVLAYLVAGVAVGPIGFGWVQDRDAIATLSDLGLMLLLFMIGLEIDLKKILGSGRIILGTAAAQILGSFVLLWLIFLGPLRGMIDTPLTALYLSVCLASSSTVIVVKILYDKRELNTLPGRITLGVLVLQDLFAILFLAIQPNLNRPGTGAILFSLAKVLLLVAVAFSLSRYVLPSLFKAVARLPELVQVGAVAWCFMVAAAAHVLGLSREMGALVAGVAVSTYPYALDVTAKVTSLRDFFVTLFFVALGMGIPAPTSGLLGFALLCSVLLVSSRFLTVLPLLHGLRQGHRVSLLVPLNLGQLSEFALVIMALGLKSGHLKESTIGVVAYTFVFLAILSSYAMNRSDGLVRQGGRWLSRMGLRDLDSDSAGTPEPGGHPSVFLLGFSWTASSLLEEIQRHHPALLEQLAVVDFNPLVYERLKQRGLRVSYGDISHRDTLIHAGIEKAKIIVCSLPNTLLKGTDNQHLLQQLRELNPQARILMHAELLTEVPRLYEAGADFVHAPRLVEALDLFEAIQAAQQNLLAEKRAAQEQLLKNRDEIMS
ncbi:MAG TPA: cation:proton antiporter [Candidatus Paceibacterota bacterium]|nr:cation:proton antiporter [Verrucomicrobiota bacterium]HRY49675.1 cation:proton antiporter [Candidatus Paceibacterota bacterium]